MESYGGLQWFATMDSPATLLLFLHLKSVQAGFHLPSPEARDHWEPLPPTCKVGSIHLLRAHWTDSGCQWLCHKGFDCWYKCPLPPSGLAKVYMVSQLLEEASIVLSAISLNSGTLAQSISLCCQLQGQKQRLKCCQQPAAWSPDYLLAEQSLKSYASSSQAGFREGFTVNRAHPVGWQKRFSVTAGFSSLSPWRG